MPPQRNLSDFFIMILPIKDTKRYFISIDGFVFKTERSKDVIIPINVIQGVPRVKVENRKLNLVLLMLEYFGNVNSKHFKTTHKITNGRIPISNIKIKYLSESSDKDKEKIFIYKCEEKANSQNCRVKYTHTITAIDVLNCLKRNDYHCFYCGEPISSKHWHLDHVTPLSKNGLNISENIVCACKSCNLMKGSIDLSTFLDRCYKITSFNANQQGKKINLINVENI